MLSASIKIFDSISNTIIDDTKEIKMNSFSLESTQIISYTETTMDAAFSIWIAQNQRIEIITGDMFTN